MNKHLSNIQFILKPFQIVLFLVIFSTFFQLANSHVHFKGKDLKKNILVKNRKLLESKSSKICKKCSDDLKEYYSIGDKIILDIDNENQDIINENNK